MPLNGPDCTTAPDRAKTVLATSSDRHLARCRSAEFNVLEVTGGAKRLCTRSATASLKDKAGGFGIKAKTRLRDKKGWIKKGYAIPRP